MVVFNTLMQVVVPVLMLIAPLAIVVGFACWAKAEVLPEKQTRARLLSWALGCGTIAGLAAFAAARVYLPWNLAMQVMFLFFPLWFGLAMPLLYLRHGAMFTMHRSDRPIRSASLRPRELDNPIPRAAWLIPWGLWGAGLGILVWAWLAGDVSNDLRWTVAIAVQAALVLLPIFGPYMIRGLLQEPEPLTESAPPELEARYAETRRFRAVGMFVLCSLLIGGHTALSVASVWGVHGETLGRWGAVVGTLIGLAGAVVGLIAGIQRGRILSRLWNTSPGPPKATHSKM